MTIRNLGYPGARATLQQWIYEYKTFGYALEPRRKTPKSRYSDEEIKRAVDFWASNGMNITKTCDDLGYPCCYVLSKSKS